MMKLLPRGLRIAFCALAIVLGAVALMQGAAANPKLTTLYRFQGPTADDGSQPMAGLAIDRNGVLYGTTAYGGTASCPASNSPGCGTAFRLAPRAGFRFPWNYSVLYNFQGGSDGANPQAALAFDHAGALFGTTLYGGGGSCVFGYNGGCGTVFVISPPLSGVGPWTETILHSFNFANGADGTNPLGSVTVGATGIVGGTTSEGGTGNCGYTPPVGISTIWGCGTVFKLTPPTGANPAWTETVLHDFYDFSSQRFAAPLYPSSGLASNGSGAIFGTASTVFELLPPASYGLDWTIVLISDVDAQGGLVADRSGALYGAASGGESKCGSACRGFVFKLSRTVGRGWTLTVLHQFLGGGDGAYPQSGVALDAKGAVYGMTSGGGGIGGGQGIVFKLEPPASGKSSWSEKIIHRFTGGLDGGAPASALVQDHAGRLYGTTASGGLTKAGPCARGGCGTVFEISP